MTNHFTLIRMAKYPISLISKIHNNNHQNKHRSLNTDQFIANMRKFNQTFVNIAFSRSIL